MRHKYGIDFGTTNSSIGFRFQRDDEYHLEIVELSSLYPRVTIPSLIFIDDDGTIQIGHDAERNSNEVIEVCKRDDSGELVCVGETGNPIRRIKMDLEKYGSSLVYRLDDCEYSVDELIAELFAFLRDKAEYDAEQNDIEIDDGVVLGVPVDYGDNQKNVLKRALTLSGFYESIKEADECTEFVSEPVAVAVYYGWDLEKDNKNVLVFDFGGGTLDIAVVNLKNQIGTDHLHPHEVLAKKRLTLGGEELNRLFFIHCFCEKYGVDKLARAVKAPLSVQDAQQLSDYIFTQSQHRTDFFNTVERCKVDLSSEKTTRVKFPPFFKLEDKVLFRKDFEEAIAPQLSAISQLLKDVIDECIHKGCSDKIDFDNKNDIDHVLLAGGSSLIPCIQNCIGEFFPYGRIQASPIDHEQGNKTDNAKIQSIEVMTSVVRGLSSLGCKEYDVVDDVVDSDYGVYTSAKVFSPIICRNTPKIDTLVDKLRIDGMCKTYGIEDISATHIDIPIIQRSVAGDITLGTITIHNYGGNEYRIFMQVRPEKSMLEVMIYNCSTHDFIPVPLNESQFSI